MRAGRLRLERATQAALAATILFVVCGSSGVHVLRQLAPLRWAALLALAASALAWAAATRASLSRIWAAAVPLVVLAELALLSAVWSVAPRVTLERGVTFTLALVAAAAIGAVVAELPAAAANLAAVVVATAVAVCLGGVVVYVLDPSVGAQAAAPGIGFRFSGLGENPNTIPMLAAVAAPLAVALAWVRDGGRRMAGAAAVSVLLAEVVASGSRGAVAAVVAAAAILAAALPASTRARVGLAVAAVAVACLSIGVAQLVQSLTAEPLATPSPAATQPQPLPRTILPSFADERGSSTFRGRRLVGNDGRLGAWEEGLHQGNAQPIVGFGFGTEERVFVDRLAQFHSARPENSYVGLYLQLGAVGTALFVAFGVLVAVAAWRRREAQVAGAAAAVAAGYVLAVGQSFVYSVGNVAMVPVWVAAFMVLGLAAPRRPRLVSVGAIGLAAALLAVPLGRWERSRAIAHQRAGIERVWRAVGARVDAPSLDGFRLSPPVDCLLYDAPAYELCFDQGRLVEAYDRRAGFHAWTLQSYAYAHAPSTVPLASVRRALRALHAFGPTIGEGPAYLARRG